MIKTYNLETSELNGKIHGNDQGISNGDGKKIKFDTLCQSGIDL